jgi:hypothetical protein
MTYKDATVTVDAGVFGGVKISVACRGYSASNLTTDQFAELIYPAIDAAAALLNPTWNPLNIEPPPPGPDTLHKGG